LVAFCIRRSIAHADQPPTLVKFLVVAVTEEGHILQISAATIRPVNDVVGLGPTRWHRASGYAAAAIPSEQCLTQVVWCSPHRSTEIKRHRLGIDHHSAYVTVTTHPPQFGVCQEACTVRASRLPDGSGVLRPLIAQISGAREAAP